MSSKADDMKIKMHEADEPGTPNSMEFTKYLSYVNC